MTENGTLVMFKSRLVSVLDCTYDWNTRREYMHKPNHTEFYYASDSHRTPTGMTNRVALAFYKLGINYVSTLAYASESLRSSFLCNLARENLNLNLIS